jgi:hypothetical protein
MLMGEKGKVQLGAARSGEVSSALDAALRAGHVQTLARAGNRSTIRGVEGA